MKIYWTFHSVPELEGLSRPEKKAIWRRHQWKALRHWQTWLAILGFVAFALLAGTILAVGLAFNKLWAVFAGPIGAAIVGALGGFILGQVIIRQTRPYLRTSEPPVE